MRQKWAHALGAAPAAATHCSWGQAGPTYPGAGHWCRFLEAALLNSMPARLYNQTGKTVCLPKKGESSSSPSGCTVPTRQQGDTAAGTRAGRRAGASLASLSQVQVVWPNNRPAARYKSHRHSSCCQDSKTTTPWRPNRTFLQLQVPCVCAVLLAIVGDQASAHAWSVEQRRLRGAGAGKTQG